MFAKPSSIRHYHWAVEGKLIVLKQLKVPIYLNEEQIAQQCLRGAAKPGKEVLGITIQQINLSQ